MNEDCIKIAKAKNIILKIAEGIDPITDKPIESVDFLRDKRIIRCLIFVSEILGRAIREKETEGLGFNITDEEKARIVLPDGKIGVTQFVKCVNTYIDLTKSKKLAAVNLNKQLKKLGILSEAATDKGNTATIINDNSASYGFESETRTYGNRSYDMILINDKGKKHLLDNLQYIMSYEAQDV